jgi:hypothetical protein
LGAILCQTDQKGKHKKNYTPFLVKMAAIVWAMELFDTYLRGRNFTVYSYHKPLEAHSKRHEKTLSRLQEAYTRWNFNIVYKKGSEMPVDNLSRNVVEAIIIYDEDLVDK